MTNSYARAYAEVYAILNYLAIEEYNQIPHEEIKFYLDNLDKEYYSEIESNNIENLNISKKANAILVILFRDYIASQAEKEELQNTLKQNYNQEQKKAYNKYNPNNIFSTNNRETDNIDKLKVEEINTDNDLIEYKNNFITLFFYKIKSFMRKLLNKL